MAKTRPTYRLCVMHPMDPRGAKLGGIETHVRQIFTSYPEDFSLIFVGVDEFGDCRLGQVRRLEIGGRTIEFLPVTHVNAARINLAATRLLQSTTLQFARGILRYFGPIRRALGAKPVTVDLQRFEYAGLARLAGLPIVQWVHGDGGKNQKMDSLLKRFWFLHRANEWLALHLAKRVLCVNGDILERLAQSYPALRSKGEVMSVSVDTDVFTPQPMPEWDGVFRVVFAGRLDSFKDPPLMFRVLAGLRERLGTQVQFHYVGTTDPHRYPEFASIADITVRHGFQPAGTVASIMAACHAGILTSFFEGLPCYLLEMLSVGRPFAAIRLPQYDPLVVDGISGKLVERTEPDAACEAALTDAFLELRAAAIAGTPDPGRIHALVEPFSVRVQMQRMFAHHRLIQDGMRGAVRQRIGAVQSVGP